MLQLFLFFLINPLFVFGQNTYIEWNPLYPKIPTIPGYETCVLLYYKKFPLPIFNEQLPISDATVIKSSFLQRK